MVDVNRFMHIKYNIPKFIINSTVFGIATLFSTLNFHIYLIPSICMAVLVVYNFKELKEIIQTVWKFVIGLIKKPKVKKDV